MKLLIFNPEHDLCLANGSPDFVPPRSAVDYARGSASLMQCLYPDALCCSAYDTFPAEAVTEVVAWGWNVAVKKLLLRGGIAENLLPSDETLERWRHLQHRQTFLPLQPDAHRIESAEQVERLLASQQKRWVLKAPWSGAGRGLHWIDGQISDNDRAWLRKTVENQGCVVAEPWRDVVEDFALEYFVRNGGLEFVGYSLFATTHGVYRENVLISDEQIVCRLREKSLPCELERVQSAVEQWLAENIAPAYAGPLGIDFVIDRGGRIHLCEVNLRHTMGMVAHARGRLIDF